MALNDRIFNDCVILMLQRTGEFHHVTKSSPPKVSVEEALHVECFQHLRDGKRMGERLA